VATPTDAKRQSVMRGIAVSADYIGRFETRVKRETSAA
jgi:hypothetical protein